MPSFARSIWHSWGCMLLFIGLVGCGSGQGTIDGRVTYKGAPVTGGTITFHLDGGKTVPGVIDSNGKYGANTTVFGKATVAIETASLKPGIMPVGDGPKVTGDSMPKTPGGSAMPVFVKIPDKYADAKTSGLTADLKSGSQSKNFELTD